MEQKIHHCFDRISFWKLYFICIRNQGKKLYFLVYTNSNKIWSHRDFFPHIWRKKYSLNIIKSIVYGMSNSFSFKWKFSASTLLTFLEWSVFVLGAVLSIVECLPASQASALDANRISSSYDNQKYLQRLQCSLGDSHPPFPLRTIACNGSYKCQFKIAT